MQSTGTMTIEYRYEIRDCGYETPCWIWIGQISGGYGVVAGIGAAHRLVYQHEVGPIPEGLTLDHLCQQKACVRPSHCEPVSGAVNTRRAQAKLTMEAVTRARAATPGSGELQQIAAEYGVSIQTLYLYRCKTKGRKRWQ